MDMDMTIVHVSYPLWFSVSIAALIVFAFVGLPLVRRSSRPILTLLFAPVFSLAISDLGIAHVAAGMSISGGGVHATAAGLAEAEVVLRLGFAVASIVSLLAAVTRSEQPSADAFARATIVIVSIFAVLLGVHSVLVKLLADGGSTFAPKAAILARLAAAMAIALLLATVVLAFWRSEKHSVVRRATFAWCSIVLLAATGTVWYVVDHFRRIAIG